MGNPQLDGLCEGYDDLYARVMQLLHDAPQETLDQLFSSNDIRLSLMFLLSTPGMRRRLEDLAHLDLTHSNPADVLVINEMSHALSDTRQNLSDWARMMLGSIQSEIVPPDDSHPETLSQNPLYVWAGAVLDEFFTADEMNQAAEFLVAHFGAFGERADARTVRLQLLGLLTLITQFLPEEKAARFAQFSTLVGVPFNVIDVSGRVIAGEQTHDVRHHLEQPDEATAGTEPGIVLPPYELAVPPLTDPSAAPHFPEEAEGLDPFGQSPQHVAVALEHVADLVGQCLARAHQHHLAISLPLPDPDTPQPYWKPWRSVLTLGEHTPAGEGGRPPGPSQHPKGHLALAQRLLVSAMAPPGDLSESYLSGLAETIEHLGYLALTADFDFKAIPKVNAFHELGRLAAAIHRAKFLQGDLHHRAYLNQMREECAERHVRVFAPVPRRHSYLSLSTAGQDYKPVSDAIERLIARQAVLASA